MFTCLVLLPVQELAWASFALLKNVNCCSVLLLQPNTQSALMARGAFSSSCVAPGDSKASLQRVWQVGGGMSHPLWSHFCVDSYAVAARLSCDMSGRRGGAPKKVPHE
jgi:hypothetical protein